jgi:hypothetical protein
MNLWIPLRLDLLESMKSGNVEGAGLKCRFAIPDGRLQQLDDSSS